MADIRCPICNRPNDANAKRCWYCQAELPHSDAAGENDSQDWLNDLREPAPGAEPSEPPEDPADSSEPPAEEVPDWLARIRTREQSERAATEEAQPAPAEEPQPEIPDWLSQLKQEQAEEPSSDTPSKTVSPQDQTENDDQEDWLKKLDTWQNSAPTSSETEQPEETAVGPEAASEDKQTTVSPEPSIEKMVPDWLQAFVEEPNSPAPAAPEWPVEQLPSPSIPVSENELQQEESLPQPAQANQASQPTDSGETSEPEASVQDLPQEESDLASFQGILADEDASGQLPTPPVVQNNIVPPFNESSLIDWMDNGKSDADSVENKPATKLEPATLPAWLQELNPKNNKEAPARPDSAKNVENIGPLAGIEGTLQGEEVHRFYKRPQTFSGLLKVTENQQIRSKLLKNIADQANWEGKDLEKKPGSQRWILRLLVALSMLAAVFIPLIFPRFSGITPSLYPAEVVQMYNTVNSLAADKPVLVAADFDGSLFGELNWSYQPVIAHLMERNIPIAFLSTNSVGATLLNQSATALIEKYPAYATSEKWMNLGYLPGGSIGLQGLAQDPRLSMPLNSGLQPAWQASPFDTIKRISDFGALIVISENADTAKYWIEQVKPSLGTTPLLVVISAQSAPLLQPYYDSGQISGYLSGLNSAVAYEALTKSPQNATGHLASYQITMILALLLVAIGGIASLVFYRPAAAKKGAGS